MWGILRAGREKRRRRRGEHARMEVNLPGAPVNGSSGLLKGLSHSTVPLAIYHHPERVGFIIASPLNGYFRWKFNEKEFKGMAGKQKEKEEDF